MSKAERRRVSALLLLVMFALASAGGYGFLGVKLAAGERRYAAGQEQLADGKTSLAEGRAELADGKRRLSEGKDEYQEASKNLLLVWADKLFKGGRGFKQAKQQIAEGELKLADGEDRIGAGEDRMDAGRQTLRLGNERLHLAGALRVACAAGAFLFAAGAMALGWRWRRSIVAAGRWYKVRLSGWAERRKRKK